MDETVKIENEKMTIDLERIFLDLMTQDQRVEFFQNIGIEYDYIQGIIDTLKKAYAGINYNPAIHKLREQILRDEEFVQLVLKEYIEALLHEVAVLRDSERRYMNAYFHARHHVCEECKYKHGLWQVEDFDPDYAIKKRADDIVERILEKVSGNNS